MKCVSNYKRMGHPSLMAPGWELLGSEVRKGMPLLDQPMGTFMGIIDLLLAKGDARQIWDFKTGKIKSQKDFEEDHQLPLYAALVAHETQSDAPIKVGRLNLAVGKSQTFLVDKDRRHAALAWAAERAHRCLDLEAEYALERAAEPTKSILCNWCAFKHTNTCPAWNMPDIV